MAKELPILPSGAQPLPGEQTETYVYSRVFCQKDNSPPLRLLLDFLKSRGQLPITPPDVNDAMLDEWAWIQIALGYSRDRKPVRVFCVRDRGSYKDVFEQEQKYFLELLSSYDDIEAQLAAAVRLTRQDRGRRRGGGRGEDPGSIVLVLALLGPGLADSTRRLGILHHVRRLARRRSLPATGRAPEPEHDAADGQQRSHDHGPPSSHAFRSHIRPRR